MARKKEDKSEVYMDRKNTISINKAIVDLKYVILGKLHNLSTARVLYLYSDDKLILNSEWVWKFMNCMPYTYLLLELQCEECSYMLLLFQEHFAKIWSVNTML